MTRSLRCFALVWGASLVVAPLAAAAPVAAAPPEGSPLLTTSGLPGRRVVVDAPTVVAAPRAQVSPIMYLERCIGGCSLRMGANDARAHTTMLLQVASATVTEFATRSGMVGAAADAEWAQLVRCMQEVYSPYDVVVTDEKPASGTYHEAIIAGDPEDVGRTSDILGLAPLANDCSAIDNAISLTFSNAHGSPNAAARIQSICWTAAQESAHAFGLDHEYAFLAGNRSTCTDPMTYRTDCGGEKFFRDDAAICGENAARRCKCGASQNSHAKLLSVFGAGTPITRAPTVTLVDPGAASDALGTEVIAMAGAQRGVVRVELRFNGYAWNEAPGAAFGANGQLDPSRYEIAVPRALPDGVIDVQVVAVDDLGAATESEVITLTRGDPCTTAARCATGQRCEAGRCLWDAPAGELGERCAYPQFCKTGVCEGAADEQICTQPCRPDGVDSCPAEMACERVSATDGVCVPVVSGGCCRVDRGGRGDLGWGHFGIGAAVLAFAIRKRRR